MSLINEALRKARQEAAQRDADQGGRLPPPGPLVTEGSARFGTGLVLGAVIAVAAALVGAGLVWLILRGGDEAAQAQQTARADVGGIVDTDGGHALQAPEIGHRSLASEPEASTTGSVPSPPDHGAHSRVDATQPIAMENGEARRGDRLDGGEGESPRADEPADGGRRESAAAGSPSAVSEASPAAVDSGRREFIAEADLGYAVLSLDYIVFRETDPFAQINGEVAHVGSVVDGFSVVAVARDHVWLRDDRGPLILKVR